MSAHSSSSTNQSAVTLRSISNMSRRKFLNAGLMAGGGLLLAFQCDGELSADESRDFAPNAYIRITPDNQIILTMPYVEMGQGTYTAIPMLLAEELEVELNQVRLEHAPPNEKLFANPLLGVQATGNSNAIRGAWEPLRSAGATSRELLRAAAAKRWGVDAKSCMAVRGEIIHASSGRRASYGSLAADASKLPVPSGVALKQVSEFKLIGTPAKRLDAKGKVDGSAVYGIDAMPAGVKFATLRQCPVFGGRLKKVNASEAMLVEGVLQIVELDDAVAVVANHTGAALKGLDALEIEWDEGENAALTTAVIAEALDQAMDGPGALAELRGDPDNAASRAMTVVEAKYEAPFLAHAAMEPMNCTAHVRVGSCEVWVGSQALARAQAAAAEASGLRPEQVIVHNHLIGGGFGRRLESDGVSRAVQIARHVDGPVKVIWSREEDIQRGMYRPYWKDRLVAGLDSGGSLVFWRHRFAGSSVISRWLPGAYKDGLDPDSIEGAIGLAYDIENTRVQFVRTEPAGVPTAFWRSVGPSHTVFVVESFIDELASAARTDPVQFRRGLLKAGSRGMAVLELVAEKSGWAKKLTDKHARGVALQNVFGSFLATVAEIELDESKQVRVLKVTCALDCGVVVNPDTVRAQIEGAVLFGASAALYGEITLQRGRFEQSNFHDYRVLRMNEAPVVDVHIVRNSEAPGGIGEVGTSCIGPAIANAVSSLTGRRIRKLPTNVTG